MGEGQGKNNWEPLRQIVEGLGYECAGIVLANEEKRQILRVFIDSVGGIVVKDCETVSRAMNRFLDEHEDYIRGHYYLEVSSPGIERPLFSLEDYRRFCGKKVKIKTGQEIGGQKRFSGILEHVGGDGEILLRTETGKGPEESETVRIPFEWITKGNLAFEENNKENNKRRNS
ncbi:MAG: ribosome maturation factor RimP [Synergistaceae bacterium]|jgi:ribosome maturation factor RimP|uniref:ribosome maturation factor RimP n=1 Tax=Aminivibrio sp. TaxID=1872489 RepID=UPI002A22778C|nr:ribosome maturation factor RimP [Synergistaceae bacterium]MDD3390440.1 ribosome maturation factor RimP [Synergistaceae bacterium]MDD4020927.1 ribosome maturation factor RimP [Synergistaceae bacterium]MDD4611455.1 ribosome maturation factor RimP [Synergistaceae bacterium]